MSANRNRFSLLHSDSDSDSDNSEVVAFEDDYDAPADDIDEGLPPPETLATLSSPSPVPSPSPPIAGVPFFRLDDVGADDSASQRSLGLFSMVDDPRPPAPSSTSAFDDLMRAMTTQLTDAQLSELLPTETEMRTESHIPSGFTNAQLLDVLGEDPRQREADRPNFQYQEQPTYDIPPPRQAGGGTELRGSTAVTSATIIADMPKAMAGPLVLVTDPTPAVGTLDANARIKVRVKRKFGDDSPGVVVGHTVPRFTGLCVDIPSDNAFDMAAMLQEDAKIKGTGGGFSTHVHLAASILIGKTMGDCILEPHEGGDVLLNDYSINGKPSKAEITGYNYEVRDTKCEWVFSKYRLLGAVHHFDCEEVEMIRLAAKEDRREVDGFVGSQFDQQRSPYSDSVDALARMTPKLNGFQRDGIVKQLKSYLYRQETIKPSPPETVSREELVPYLEQVFRVCGKYHAPSGERNVKLSYEELESGTHDDNIYLPCPYRVLAGQPLTGTEPVDAKLIKVRPRLSQGADRYTYNTIPLREFSRIEPLASAPYTIEGSIEESTSTFRRIYNDLLKFDGFQSAHIEAQLLGKIQGAEGNYYDVHQRAGICWKRLRSGSPTYYIAYYTLSEPPETRRVGRWEKLVDCVATTVYYRSPTSKIDLAKIAHAETVPYRMFTMLISGIAYLRPGERAETYRKFMSILPIIMHSSWATTVVSGDSRFTTLCSMMRTGAPNTMFKKAFDVRWDTRLSKGIAYYARLVFQYATRSRIDPKLSPLLELPLKFCAVEKDLPLAMSWHMRGSEHDTECMIKMLKAASEEVRDKAVWVESFRKQVRYLEDLLTVGVSQQRFDELMDVGGVATFYNHILFIALARQAVPYLKEDVGARQKPIRISVQEMLTDHNMQSCKRPGALDDRNELAPIKVHDGILKVLKRYRNPKGIHRLLVRMKMGKHHIPNINRIHPKDGKSADREISQMTPEWRPLQFAGEQWISPYCEEEEVDNMLSAGKALRFTMQASDTLKEKGALSSEDKSFFCGRIWPECLALTALCIGLEANSTTVIASSSVTLVDRRRTVVMPVEMDESRIPDNIVTREVNVIEHTKQGKALAFDTHIHMQQGLRALSAAGMSTTFIKGLQKTQKEMAPEVKTLWAMTTSDDAEVGVTQSDIVQCDRSTVDSEILGRPHAIMRAVMMENNKRKLIVGRKFGEFNNMVANVHGMVPQQTIHSHLAVQPLRGQSFYSDLESSISAARATISWGDSIDLAQAAMAGATDLLRKKWLINDEQLDLLYALNFIPNSTERLLEGPALDDDQIIANIWNSHKEEEQEKVLKGEISFLAVLRSMTYARRKKKHKKKYATITDSSMGLRALDKSNTIVSSRKYQEKQRLATIRATLYSDRFAAKERFFTLISGVSEKPAEDTMRRLRPLVRRARVVIEPLRQQAWHLTPCVIGGTRSNPRETSYQSVFALRHAGLEVGCRATDEERILSRLPDDELRLAIATSQREKETIGFTVQSPYGLPPFQFINNKILRSPASFSFYVELPDARPAIEVFTHEGKRYDSFMICELGGSRFKHCVRENLIPAFGYARGVDGLVAFYKEPGRPVQRKVVPPTCVRSTNAGVEVEATVQLSRGKLFVQLQPDISAIDPNDFLEDYTYPRDHIPGITGDPLATLNYGSYLHSSSQSAMGTMGKIFRSMGADRPMFLSRNIKTYPFFPAHTVDIQAGRTTVFRGGLYVRKVRLTLPAGSGALDALDCRVEIDAGKKVPTIVPSRDYELDDSFLDI